MAIDKCRFSFARLAKPVLPRYMTQLRRRMAQPAPMSQFATKGVGVQTLLRQFGLTRDFSGCYVLIEGVCPVYVGISRAVFRRLRQHVCGTTHYDASLAYRMVAARLPRTRTRNAAMADGEFGKRFCKKQKYLRSLSVAFLEVDNPVELYLFEAYCAMELDTSKWNTFGTH